MITIKHQYTTMNTHALLSKLMESCTRQKVACFQMIMDNFVKRHNLKKTFAYLESVIIAAQN